MCLCVLSSSGAEIRQPACDALGSFRRFPWRIMGGGGGAGDFLDAGNFRLSSCSCDTGQRTTSVPTRVSSYRRACVQFLQRALSPPGGAKSRTREGGAQGHLDFSHCDLASERFGGHPHRWTSTPSLLTRFIQEAADVSNPPGDTKKGKIVPLAVS